MNWSKLLNRIRVYWLGPFLIVLTFYLLAVTLGDSGSLFQKIYLAPERGQIPEVVHNLSLRGTTALLLIVLSFAAMVYTMRQWARYYLNRKLVLSYLVLALFPFMCTLIIFFLGSRAMVGIMCANTVENTLINVAEDLAQISDRIMLYAGDRIRAGDSQVTASALEPIVDISRQSNSEFADLDVSLYWGNTSYFGIYPKDDFYNEKEFQVIKPKWLDFSRQKYWVNLIQKESQLYIQYSRFEDLEEFGNVFMTAKIPVDQKFMVHLQDIIDVDIALEEKLGNWRLESKNSTGNFLFRAVFRPFRSKWEVLTLDWETGAYTPAADLSFQIRPDTLLSGWGKNPVHFLGDGAKEIQFYLIFFVTLALVIAQLSAFVFGIYLVSYITRSLNSLAVAHEQVAGGELEYRMPELGKDQLGAMAKSFNHMVGNISYLLNEVREKEKYQEELRIAREIQMSLLPDPNSLDFGDEVGTTCIPAKDVGGDYYDIFHTEQGNLGFIIADVSGKGTSAAFYMAELKGVLIALHSFSDDPHELMLRVNQIITPALKSNIFISAAYLLLKPEEKKGYLARAGHSPALHVKEDGSVSALQPAGMALGLADNKVFGKILSVDEFDVSPGDKVVLYTDGLDEMSNNDELYGMKRLEDVVSEHCQKSAKVLRDKILEDVLGFLSNDVQNDDLTLVVASLPSSLT